jgi:hypothetical protein
LGLLGYVSGNKNAPDLHQAGLRFGTAAAGFYARTTPEAPEGFPVLVLVFAAVIMAREHMGGRQSRQRLLRPALTLNEVATDAGDTR